MPRVVSASRVIRADAAVIFDHIADPAKQLLWDGNDNLGQVLDGQRVTAVGQRFTMDLTHGAGARDNEVVEFEEGRRIAWLPGDVGRPRAGHLWRWELEPVDGGILVTHTYDWTRLDPDDARRNKRASRTTDENLAASIRRLAALVEP